MSKLTNAQDSGLQKVFAGIIGAGILFLSLAAKPVDIESLPSNKVQKESSYDNLSYEELNAIAEENERLKELSALAMTIHCEAKGESYIGKKLVGEVIQNRVKSKRYKNTYHEVVYQPYQFSCWNEGNSSGLDTIQAFDSDNPHKSVVMSLLAAKEILENDSAILPDNTMYYFVANMKKPPKWSKSAKLKKVETVGAHVFYLRP